MAADCHERLSRAQQLEFAWKAHEANVGWIKGVDQKASIVLVFATALAGLVADQALSHDGALADAAGLTLAAVVVTGSLYSLAAFLALLVVRPHLRPRKAKAAAPNGLIYFGHLTSKGPCDIEQALERLSTDRAQIDLARQLAALGQIGWRKHRLLQWSLNLIALGTITFAFARFVL